MEDALTLLRVASHLQFDRGVSAACDRIQSVPWTIYEEASVADYFTGLHLPSWQWQLLTPRLQGAGESIRSSRDDVKLALVGAWERSFLEWRNALQKCSSDKQPPTHGTQIGLSCEASAFSALSKTVAVVGNSIFGLFRRATNLGFGDDLIYALTTSNNFAQVVAESQNMNNVLSYEAVLLVLLRVMQALVTWEVVCYENLGQDVVRKCQAAITGSSSCVLQQFRPNMNVVCLKLACSIADLHADLGAYVKAYMCRKGDIQKDLVTCMGKVVCTLSDKKRQIPGVELLQSIPHAEVSYLDLEEMVTTLTATAEFPSLQRPSKHLQDGLDESPTVASEGRKKSTKVSSSFQFMVATNLNS